MYDNTEQTEPPTLADIVRRETNNGETIVRFYLDVIEGKLNDDGFEVCHRLEAAEQVHAIAPGLVSEYIAQLTGLECNHVLLRKRTRDTTTVIPAKAGTHRSSGDTTRRSRDDTTVIPVATGTHPRPDADCAKTARARHEALEYLASALAAPSLKDDPRVAGIVHGSTDHGKTVVSFLMHVMHGVVRGFRPRQRVDAASELLGHIARDEIARSGSVPPSPSTGEGEGAPSFPRRACPVLDTGREPIPSTANADDPHTATATESSFPTAGSSFPPDGSSFPRRREPIPSTDEADLTVTPAEPGIQGGGDEGGLPPSPSPLTGEGWGEGEDDLEDHRGCYDIDRKIAEAQRDPAHPIHKFIQAYDEVAAVFHGKDKENDEDDEVRYWISGEVPDAYGKYIWEYAPAYPRSIRRKLRPKRRRSREPGTTPKAESMDEAALRQDARGRHPQTQPVQNLGLNPPRRPTGPGGANTTPANELAPSAPSPHQGLSIVEIGSYLAVRPELVEGPNCGSTGSPRTDFGKALGLR